VAARPPRGHVFVNDHLGHCGRYFDTGVAGIADSLPPAGIVGPAGVKFCIDTPGSGFGRFAGPSVFGFGSRGTWGGVSRGGVGGTTSGPIGGTPSGGSAVPFGVSSASGGGGWSATPASGRGAPAGRRAGATFAGRSRSLRAADRAAKWSAARSATAAGSGPSQIVMPL